MADPDSRIRAEQPRLCCTFGQQDTGRDCTIRPQRQGDPSSASAYDRLSEGYAAAGMWKEAAKASDQAAALANQYDDPNRRYFVEQARKRNDRLKQEKAQ